MSPVIYAARMKAGNCIHQPYLTPIIQSRGRPFNVPPPGYGQHFRIVRYVQCGFIYANPRISSSEILEACQSVEDPLYLQECQGRERTFCKHLAPVHSMTGAPNGHKLLDVGAYTGVFVEVAQAAGWEAVGVEPSAWPTQAQQSGIPDRLGTLSSVSFSPESFAVITLWDVIEHFDAPRVELESVYCLLRPSGIVVIHTIDADSPTAKLLGGRWPFLMEMEMHIAFFSRTTLTAMLEQVGLRHIQDHTQGRYLRLVYLAGRVSAAFGSLLGQPLEKTAAALKLGGVPVPINTLDLFTAYAQKK